MRGSLVEARMSLRHLFTLGGKDGYYAWNFILYSVSPPRVLFYVPSKMVHFLMKLFRKKFPAVTSEFMRKFRTLFDNWRNGCFRKPFKLLSNIAVLFGPIAQAG